MFRLGIITDVHPTFSENNILEGIESSISIISLRWIYRSTENGKVPFSLIKFPFSNFIFLPCPLFGYLHNALNVFFLATLRGIAVVPLVYVRTVLQITLLATAPNLKSLLSVVIVKDLIAPTIVYVLNGPNKKKLNR